MEWTQDVRRGEWLKERLDPSWRDMHVVVPHGYEAYARVFHPALRDRPADTESRLGRENIAAVDIDRERSTWRATAEAFGTQMHSLAQYHRLVGASQPGNSSELDAAGWRYTEPAVGNLDVGILASAATHLAKYTSTPNTCVAAIWEGWGGLATGSGYSVLATHSDESETTIERIDVYPSSSALGTGLLPPEVAAGPLLELPERRYYLFDVVVSVFAEPSWPAAAPWVHQAMFPQSPSLIWPEDRSWVLVTEIDFDSTIVAGSLGLVSSLCQDPAIEALIIREGADLTWDADIVNRPDA